jgi:hypothetical protein
MQLVIAATSPASKPSRDAATAWPQPPAGLLNLEQQISFAGVNGGNFERQPQPN